MICCDICRKELFGDRTSMAVSWSEEMKDTGYGTPVIGKEVSYDLCADCRKAILNHMAEMKAAREDR